MAQAADVRVFWERALQTQIHACFKLYAEFEAYVGEPRIFPWMDCVVPLPPSNANDLKKLNLVQTGIAAAAKSDGRAGDGIITIEELERSSKVTLHNHVAYQLAAALSTSCDHRRCHHRKQLREGASKKPSCRGVRRSIACAPLQQAEIHPHIAVLTGQATDPYSLPQPVIVPSEKIDPRKIVGTLFTSGRLPTPPRDENAEFVTLPDLGIVYGMLDDAKLFKVSGRSAGPIALDGQFIISRPARLTDAALTEMDGRLVIAVDETGTRYLKRLGGANQLSCLKASTLTERLRAEALSLDGKLGFPRLTGILEVVGVLFELPS